MPESVPTLADHAALARRVADLEAAVFDAPPTPTPTPEPAPVEPTPPSTTTGILLSPTEVAALPTAGPGWDAIAARVAKPYGGAYKLGVRDDSNKDVLAHALYGARLGDVQAKTFARDKISAMMDAGRNTSDVLATLRNLQAYIVAADLIDLRSFDATLDSRFRTWLAEEIRFVYSGGGGGGSVIGTHDKKPNNFGTHAGACRIAAALYLGDVDEYGKARDVWRGWAEGVTDTPGRAWSGTTWQADHTGSMRYGINPAGASRDGHDIGGVIPEDQRRCGEFAWPPCATNYIHGATDGMTLAFWMMGRRGESCWSWGDSAARRQMDWKYANGQPPYSGFRWQLRVIEKTYGVTYAGHEPGATSTNFGYADWWAQ